MIKLPRTFAYFTLFLFLSTSISFGEDCAKVVQKLCGHSNTPAKCLQEKKSSLPTKCRVEMQKNAGLMKALGAGCMKAIQSSCKLDVKALQKNQKAYMNKYKVCIKKNQKKIESACKSVKKYVDKNIVSPAKPR